MGYRIREPCELLYWVFCGLIIIQLLISKQKLAKDFGKRIRKVRKDRGISLKDVEAKSNSITRGNLSAIESGKRSPSLYTIYKIAHLFGVPPKEFF